MNRIGILHITLIAFVFTIPYNIQANNATMILLFIAFLVNGKMLEIWNFFKQSLMAKLFSTMYIIYVLWAIFNGFSKGYIAHIDQKLLMVALPCLFSGIYVYNLMEETLKLLRSSFLISVFVCFAFAIYDYTITLDYNEFLYLKLIDNIKFHSIEYSLFLSIFGFYSLHNYLEKNQKNIFELFSTIVFSATVIALSVRGTILLHFLILIIYLIRYYWQKEKHTKAFLIPILTIALCFTAIYNIPTLKSRFHRALNSKSEIEKFNRLNGLSGRIVIWRNAMEILEENWLIGVGPSLTQDFLNAQYQKDPLAKEALEQDYNCHNQYLQTFIAIGIIGFLLLVFIQITSIYRSFKYKDIFLIITSLTLLISPITESLLEVNKGTIFFIIFHLIIENKTSRPQKII